MPRHDRAHGVWHSPGSKCGSARRKITLSKIGSSGRRRTLSKYAIKRARNAQ